MLSIIGWTQMRCMNLSHLLKLLRLRGWRQIEVARQFGIQHIAVTSVPCEIPVNVEPTGRLRFRLCGIFGEGRAKFQKRLRITLSWNVSWVVLVALLIVPLECVERRLSGFA